MPVEEPINIGEFRDRFAELVRSVEQSGGPIVISRRGQPVVELRKVGARNRRPLQGSVTVAAGFDLTEPVVAAEDWEAQR